MGKSRKSDTQRKAVCKRTIFRLDKKNAITILQGIVLTGIIAFLFYRSLVGILTGLFILPYWIKLKEENEQQENNMRKSLEFKEYMMLIVAGLQTGYALERALLQSEKEFIRLYPKESVLLEAIHKMNQKIKMNMQVETAFLDFAKEVDLEEAENLAEIISFAKRSGGNYGKNIHDTALKIEENLAVKEEIETITTEKRLELKVMCYMPLGILAYISITSKGFIAPLYGNVVGVILMTVCLIMYGLLIRLGRRIIDIKV